MRIRPRPDLWIMVAISAMVLPATRIVASQQQVPWPRVEPIEAPPAERPLRAGFLIVDGVYNSELMAPYDILQHTIFHVQPGIEVFTVSPDGEPVTTFEGLTVGAHYSFQDVPQIDILVVPSTVGSMDADLKSEQLMTWVKQVGRQARCSMPATVITH